LFHTHQRAPLPHLKMLMYRHTGERGRSMMPARIGCRLYRNRAVAFPVRPGRVVRVGTAGWESVAVELRGAFGAERGDAFFGVASGEEVGDPDVT
jgi:hypothetical protein